MFRQTGIGKRTLQRIFNEYVGVSPKWVIRRYQLHELIERIHSDSGKSVDWAEFALELGYFDHAHLINDFRLIVGYPPVQYQKREDRRNRPDREGSDDGDHARSRRLRRLRAIPITFPCTLPQ